MSFINRGRSPFGAFIRSPFGAKTTAALGRNYILTNPTTATSKIYEIDSEYNIINSGVGPSAAATNFGTLAQCASLGSDGNDKLWFLDSKAGIIRNLDADDFSVINSFSAPMTASTSCGITADDGNVYAAFSGTLGVAAIYKLDPDTLATVASATLPANFIDPSGLGGIDGGILWCMTILGAAANHLGNFDRTTLSLVSDIGNLNTLNPGIFPGGIGAKIDCVDGTDDIIKVIEGFNGSSHNVFTLNGSGIYQSDAASDAGIVETKLRSICGFRS